VKKGLNKGVNVLPLDAPLLLIFSLLVIFSILAVELKDLLKSAISLAVASAILAIIFYQLDAPYAAMFELSVCAGLITVLFASTINLTKGSEEHEEE
jgi:NADH-quinone oxidoreductase subunit J